MQRRGASEAHRVSTRNYFNEALTSLRLTPLLAFEKIISPIEGRPETALSNHDGSQRRLSLVSLLPLILGLKIMRRSQEKKRSCGKKRDLSFETLALSFVPDDFEEKDLGEWY